MEINMFAVHFFPSVISLWTRNRTCLELIETRRIYLSILWIALQIHRSVLINYSFDTFGNCMNNFGFISMSTRSEVCYQIHVPIVGTTPFLGNCFHRCSTPTFSCTHNQSDRNRFECHAKPPPSVAFCKHVVIENNNDDDDGCLSFSHVAHRLAVPRVRKIASSIN